MRHPGKIHFPGGELTESTGSRNGHTMRAANGSVIKDEGLVTVRAKTENGASVEIPFINANVEMPILSIAKLGKSHDTFFGEHKGSLINRTTKQEIPFVKKAGVYFMIAVKKSVAHPEIQKDQRFGRSGAN